MAVETSAGILVFIAVVVMLLNLRASPAAFAKGKASMILACLATILICGVGFMVVAGDSVPHLAGENRSGRHPTRRDDLFSALRARAGCRDQPPGGGVAAENARDYICLLDLPRSYGIVNLWNS